MSRLARLLRESAVEALLVRLSKARSWLAMKLVSPGLRGVPDRLVLKGIGAAVQRYLITAGPMSYERAEWDVRELLASIIEFVELKAPGQKPTLQQLHRHEQLRKLGFRVTVLDSQEAVREWELAQ